MPGLFIVVGLLACETPESDSERYVRILTDTETANAVLLRDCKELVDNTLRGDCSLALALRGAGTAGASKWCPEVEAGMWRDECWFSVAESAAMRGNMPLAREHCLEAGQFQESCNYHAFQQDVHRAISGAGDLGVMEQTLSELLTTWKLDRAPAALERIWTEWFRAVLMSRKAVAEDDCVPVSDAHRAACEAGLLQARGLLHLR